jgi:hypothetical protein
MRVLVTGRQTFTPVYQAVLQRLVNILGIVSKNPSNPNFDQYTFESIAALLRSIFLDDPLFRMRSATKEIHQIRGERHPQHIARV